MKSRSDRKRNLIILCVAGAVLVLYYLRILEPVVLIVSAILAVVAAVGLLAGIPRLRLILAMILRQAERRLTG